MKNWNENTVRLAGHLYDSDGNGVDGDLFVSVEEAEGQPCVLIGAEAFYVDGRSVELNDTLLALPTDTLRLALEMVDAEIAAREAQNA